MSRKKYKEQVERRVGEEQKAMEAKAPARKQDPSSELTTEVIRTYFDEDGVGDGKLFNRLHRDKIVGVIDSDDFLFWNGAHWEKAKEKQEFRAIEDVVRLYERLAVEKEKEFDSVDKRDDPDLKKELQKQLGAIRRRIKTLRDAPGQDNLKKMTARVDPPLLVYPEQLDDKPRLMPCPNGVINLETGELEQGRPRDYLLTACETEYEPGLLDVEDPCPVANDFLLRRIRKPNADLAKEEGRKWLKYIEMEGSCRRPLLRRPEAERARLSVYISSSRGSWMPSCATTRRRAGSVPSPSGATRASRMPRLTPCSKARCGCWSPSITRTA